MAKKKTRKSQKRKLIRMIIYFVLFCAALVAVVIINPFEFLGEDVGVSTTVKHKKHIETRIWIGDSRTEGLQLNAKYTDFDCFIAKGGEAYSWFSDKAIEEIGEYLDDGSAANVIINMGVNDCADYLAGAEEDSVDKYIADINRLIKEYPNAQFYYMSVNPVDGGYPTEYSSKGYIDKEDLNKEIERFNKRIKSKCKAEYIDCNGYLTDDGYDTYDGIHYTDKTNQKIYEFIVNYLP